MKKLKHVVFHQEFLRAFEKLDQPIKFSDYVRGVVSEALFNQQIQKDKSDGGER